MPGLDGLKKMAALMDSLRKQPPADIGGTQVVCRKDYQDGSVVDVKTGERSAMELSGSNVLRFELADGTSVLVRPSGTEPKVKVYVPVSYTHLDVYKRQVYVLTQGDSQAQCDERVARYAAWAERLKQ